VWTERAPALPQLLLGSGVAVAGVLLAVAARGQAGSNGRAALLLGLSLAVAGVAAALTAGSETTRIDPVGRTITVTRQALLGAGTRVLPFAQVRDVHLNYLGKASSGVWFYSLRLDLVGGRTAVLFAPGRFYPGGSSRSVADERRRRLLALVGPVAAS
jgi:drug/metabolite transporter (DMT)-like permease